MRRDGLKEPRLALLWAMVILLVVIGVVAAVSRTIFVGDLVIRAEPIRQQILQGLERNDPRAPYRAEEARRYDAPFAAHPLLTWLHVVPGGLFLTLVPFQFSARMRSRYINVHRWCGRVLLGLALAAGVSALYFGLLTPFGGTSEAAAVVIFGGLFLMAGVRAFVAIRRGDVARHREWMIRAFAIAVGVSTTRIVGAIFDIALAPAGFRMEDLFVASLWTGWLTTLGAAEVWIRHTAPGPKLMSAFGSLTARAPKR